MKAVVLTRLKLRSFYAIESALGSMLKVSMGYLYIYSNADFAELKDACKWPRITGLPDELGSFLPRVAALKYEPEPIPMLRDARFGDVDTEILRECVLLGF